MSDKECRSEGVDEVVGVLLGLFFLHSTAMRMRKKKKKKKE